MALSTYRCLKIEREKGVGYQISQINNEWFFFVGKIEVYERDRFWSSRKNAWAFLNTVIGETTGNSDAAIAKESAEDSALSYLMIPDANVL